jgi:uncharacterized protein (DUF952 family)
MQFVYKIMTRADYQAGLATGAFPVAAVDARDGYTHLSSAEQAPETARLHFSGAGALVALAFDADAMGAALKWEPSRGGALFPHFYGVLDPSDIVAAHALGPDKDGVWRLGEAQ